MKPGAKRIPRTSRREEIDRARKYTPVKGEQFVCIPVEFFSELLLGGKLRSGTQTQIVLLMARELWNGRSLRPAQPEPAPTWTRPVTDGQIAAALGCTDKMVRIAICDAVNRGIVLARPGQEGGWSYNLAVTQWGEVPPYTPPKRPIGSQKSRKTTKSAGAKNRSQTIGA